MYSQRNLSQVRREEVIRYMKATIYFLKESPDFNCMLEKGRTERIAANRVILCTISEFGLMNNRRMSTLEYSSFIETQQIVTGKFKEEPKVFLKIIPLYFTSILPNEVSIECTA